MFIKINDLVINDHVGHPGRRPARASQAVGNKLQSPRSAAGTTILGHPGLVQGGVSARCIRARRRNCIPGRETSSWTAIMHPPPADRHPEPARHQRHPVHACWRWRRAIRSRSLRPIRRCRPRCARRCAPSSASMIRCGMRYLHWLTAMVQGDWGFSFAEPHRRRHADPAAPAGDAVRDRRRRRCSPSLVALPVGVLAAIAALFDLRPDRQHARLHRLLAADLLHRPAADPGVHDPARLAALRLSRRHQRHRLALATGSTSSSRSCRSSVLGLSQAASLARYRALRRCST